MENLKHKTIGVFFGSRSPEHDISIITAQLIIHGLKGLGYKVEPIYITKKGEWLLSEKLGGLKTFTEPKGDIDVTEYKSFYLDLEKSRGKLVFTQKGIMGKEISVDVAFPAFHGSFGEDGTVQGLFEILDVPYVGCGVAASAIAMDKVLTKLFYRAHGIPTTQFLYFTKEGWTKNRESVLRDIRDKLKWPVFVKPSSLGSSIGMAKAKTDKELEFAIEVALHYDPKFLVEESVEDLTDVTCSVIGNEEPVASELQESVFAGSEFFSYEDKYLKEGGAQLGKAVDNIVIPARLDDATAKDIRDMALRIYKFLGCSGIARIDFLYDKSAKKAYANEINPLPGTLYHHLWKASGVEFPDLLERLLKLAIERHESKKSVTYAFESDILRRAGGAKLSFRK